MERLAPEGSTPRTRPDIALTSQPCESTPPRVAAHQRESDLRPLAVTETTEAVSSLPCPHNRQGKSVRSCPHCHPPPRPLSRLDARQQKARKRHQGEAIEGEEGDAIPDLLLQLPDTTLAT